MSNYIIKTSQLEKSYRGELEPVKVLKGIDLRIEENEFVAIQGPSGAGKSTLLHILGGLDFPTAGRVFFQGKDVFSLSENERAFLRNIKIGFVFQFYHLLPELTALENVLLPAIIKSWWDKKKNTLYAKSILEGMGLKERLNHKSNQLSGGEQQRVAVARALMNRPKLLLCDEPTGNLDSENGENILNLLKKLNQEENTSVVLVTHDRDIAKAADRVINLKDGIILN